MARRRAWRPPFSSRGWAMILMGIGLVAGGAWALHWVFQQ